MAEIDSLPQDIILPSNYYFEELFWVLIIIIFTIALIVLIFLLVSKRKTLSYAKRGTIIGFFISLIWIFVNLIFINCHWNPVEGSVVSDGICKNHILGFVYYIPFLVGQVISIILIAPLSSLWEVSFTTFFIISSIFFAGITSGMSYLIGLVIGKIRKSK